MISSRALLAELLAAGMLPGGALLPGTAAEIRRRPETHWCSEIPATPQTQVSNAHFMRLLSEVAAGWNSGDAGQAAACFTEDAVYAAAGDTIAHRGRAELFEFFGGERGRPTPMLMTWHHYAFDVQSQIGFGEYTFGYQGSQSHGVVVLLLRAGRIARWREYEFVSRQSWAKVTAANPF